jgi:GMC oxidoreductase
LPLRTVQNLRVVDASVMPTIPRANINLTCIMIGKHVSDWMRDETFRRSYIAGIAEACRPGRDLPVFAFRLADPQAGYTVFDLGEWLRTRGWLVPANTFPEGPDRHGGHLGHDPQRLHPRPGRPVSV